MSRRNNNLKNEIIIPIQIEDDSGIVSNVDHLPHSSSPEDNSDANSGNDISSTTNQNINILPSNINTQCCETPKVDIELPERMLPTYNVPEKVILVLDRAQDDNCNFFEVGPSKISPLVMLKRSIEMFLQNKFIINSHHQYALIVLDQNSATWVHGFTNNPEEIITCLDTITNCESEDIFDMNILFNLINKNVTPNTIKKDLIVPPSSVIRTILMYGRSYCIPQLTESHEINEILESPYFTVDVVMTHEPPNAANQCNKIFKNLQLLQPKGFGYFFSVSRDVCDLYLAMAKLLSHPLQRPHQSIAKYDLNQVDV